METSDKRVETLEDEFKLIKGEVKQTLASVRDYLINIELPASEYATILQALDGADQKMSMKGGFSMNKDTGIGESAEPGMETDEQPPEEPVGQDELPPEEDLVGQDEPQGPESELPPEEDLVGQDEPQGPESELLPEEGLVGQDEPFMDESELLPEEEEEEESVEGDEPFMDESELPPEEELPMEHGKISAEVSQSIPKVNLLANLIHWVANAKREIGSEQLPTFLEVYGISGHLSPELKEVILQLADITSEQSADGNAAEIWSQSILELHGILTGGDAPLHPVRPFWNNGGSETQPSETEAEADKPKDKPLKLKLVLSNGDGTDKEFCINLSPEDTPPTIGES